MRIRALGHRLVLEVRDQTDQLLPRLLDPGPAEEAGRGLQLVGALSEQWGIRDWPGGKAVWCQFQLPAPATTADAPG